jgi:hypothetical protein
MPFSRTVSLVSILLLAGCSSTVQTTSGRAYLENPALTPIVATDDTAFRAAAAVEPLLTFPARIGIARIDRGELTAVPAEEAAEWLKLAERLAPSWGEFVPVSPLVARMASAAGRDAWGERPGGRYVDRVDEVVRQVRLGAARQHIDATLIYEVRSRDDSRSTPLALLDLTILGAWIVPSRALEATGFATALLVDVRNGYPYGFTDTVTDAQDAFRPAVGSEQTKLVLAEEAKTGAVRKLVPEVEKLALKLHAELAERRLAAGGR